MHTLKHILRDYFQQNPVQKGVDFERLYQSWEALLGEYLSQRITPVNFENGTLFCYVNSSSLIQELKLGLSKDILLRLQKINVGAPIKNLRIVSESKALPSRILEDFKQIAQNESKLRHKMSIRHFVALSDRQKEQICINAESITQAETRQKAANFMIALAKRQAELQANHWSVCRDCQTYYAPHLQKCPLCCLEGKS